MFKLSCFFGSHKWKLVAVNRRYHFTVNNSKQFFTISFYECSSCKKRRASTNKSKYDGHHNGAEFAQQAWIETRMLPPGSKHPEEMEGWQRPEQITVPVQVKDNVVKLERIDKR